MATFNTTTSSSSSAVPAPHHQPSEFEVRRAALVGEIGDALEQVLTQINALNRSLEGIIEIGNEFASVEALWSQFEGVMGRGVDESEHPPPPPPTTQQHGEGATNGDPRDSVGKKVS